MPQMSQDESPIGRNGVLSVGTRGSAGPGEVVLKIRGGTETFLAWSNEPLAKGVSVIVIEAHGARTVTVAAWSDAIGSSNL
jgi:hypothetical protein